MALYHYSEILETLSLSRKSKFFSGSLARNFRRLIISSSIVAVSFSAGYVFRALQEMDKDKSRQESQEKALLSPAYTNSIGNTLTEESQLVHELKQDPFLPSDSTSLVARMQNPDFDGPILPDYSNKDYEQVEESTNSEGNSVFDFRDLFKPGETN